MAKKKSKPKRKRYKDAIVGAGMGLTAQTMHQNIMNRRKLGIGGKVLSAAAGAGVATVARKMADKSERRDIIRCTDKGGTWSGTEKRCMTKKEVEDVGGSYKARKKSKERRRKALE